MRLVETWRRKQIIEADALHGIVHDYEEHLDAAKRGVDVDCFCVQSPFVLWVVDGGKDGPPQKSESSESDYP